MTEPFWCQWCKQATGLWRWPPRPRDWGMPARRAHSRTLGFEAPVLCMAPLSPSWRGTEISHDDSCFSSISFITVGSARLRVAFRTKPISLFIALGFPFFRSITTWGCSFIVAWQSCSRASWSCISSSLFSETICAGVFPPLLHSSSNTFLAAAEEIAFWSSRLRSSASAEGVTGLSLTARFCCFKKPRKVLRTQLVTFFGFCPSFFHHILEELQ